MWGQIHETREDSLMRTIFRISPAPFVSMALFSQLLFDLLEIATRLLLASADGERRNWRACMRSRLSYAMLTIGPRWRSRLLRMCSGPTLIRWKKRWDTIN